MNEYKFDNHVLKRLIKQITRKDKRNKLQKITFSYYNYSRRDIDMPSNDTIFINPHHLDVRMLNSLKTLEWTIKSQKNGERGYKITVYKIVEKGK